MSYQKEKQKDLKLSNKLQPHEWVAIMVVIGMLLFSLYHIVS